MGRPTTIYALCHPITNEIRYVGKSVKPKSRYRDHCCTRGRTRVSNWVFSLPREPIMIELETVFSDWVEAEQFWIAYFKSLGARLTNLTLGGEGTLGRVATEETRKKLSTTGVGNKNALGNKSGLGKHYKHTKETKERLSTIGKGRKHSEETKRRVSLAGIGRKHSDEVKTKLSLANIGKKLSEETRIKMSIANIGKTHTEETKLKISTVLKGNKYNLGKILPDEHRLRISESVKQYHANKRALLASL